MNQPTHGSSVSAQLQQISALQQEIIKLMASVASQLASVQSALTNVGNQLNNIASGVTALDTLIQSLEAASSGASSTLSTEDQATLTQIITQSSALNQQALAVNTSAPTPPAPAAGS